MLHYDVVDGEDDDYSSNCLWYLLAAPPCHHSGGRC